MKGVIDKIWGNKTGAGKDYWVLTLGGERYSVWDSKYMRGIREGTTVEYDWAESGDFKKITGINILEGGDIEPSVRPGYKDQQIVRMACLKSASSLLSSLDAEPDQKGEVTLGLARKFEKYVMEPEVVLHIRGILHFSRLVNE